MCIHLLTSDSCNHLMLGFRPSLLRSEMIANPNGSQGLPVCFGWVCGWVGGGSWVGLSGM